MRPFLAVLAFGLLAACRGGTPEIGKDLPTEYSKAQPLFDARVKALFPIGTREEAVRRTLDDQGFVLSSRSDDFESATYTRDELVMKTIWSVRWRARNGRIEEIWGVHGAIAP